jgi:hypothetical protein
MKLSKKKINQIRFLSVYQELLQDHGFNMSFDDPPEMWGEEKKKMFDLLNDVEDKLKDKIINLLSN